MPRPEQIDRQRDRRVPRPAHRRDLRHRVRQYLRLGQPRIGQLVHETGVRPILQQPPDQIRQQVAVPAHRRIDATMIPLLPHQPLVQPIAHPMQSLELEIAVVARPFQDGGDGQRIVAGKGRADILGRQHVLGDRQIGHVGCCLAREQRIVRQSLDLRALDLRIPVCALDQPHVHDPAEAVRPFDHRPRPLAISLHRHAEAFPAVQAGQSCDRADDVETHLQPLGFLGIHRQRDSMPRRLHRQRLQHLRQRRHALRPPRDLIPRMQCRQLHRHRMSRRRIAAHRVDRLHISLEVALGVLVRPRRLAQHVEAGGKTLVLRLLHPARRLVDGAAHHEDLAHHPHRSAHALAHERLPRPRDQALERSRLALADQRTADDQPPGGGVDETRRRLAGMRTPVRIAQLVRDQQVRRFRVRHAQECLGQAEQRDALGRVQPIFLQELVHPAPALRRAQVGEQARGMPHDPLP